MQPHLPHTGKKTRLLDEHRRRYDETRPKERYLRGGKPQWPDLPFPYTAKLRHQTNDSPGRASKIARCGNASGPSILKLGGGGGVSSFATVGGGGWRPPIVAFHLLRSGLALGAGLPRSQAIYLKTMVGDIFLERVDRPRSLVKGHDDLISIDARQWSSKRERDPT